MVISVTQITVGTRLFFTGVLHTSSYGEGVTRRFNSYPVRIVRIIPGRLYPVLLGDDYSNVLGWVSYDELTSHGNGFIVNVETR